jgi:uncharacterized protein
MGTESMRIEISRIPPEGIELDRSIPLTEIEISDLPEELAGSLHFRGRIDLTSNGVIIGGKVDGQWRLHCSRCLESVDFPVSDSFRIFLNRSAPEVYDKSLDLELENLDESEIAGDDLDLGFIIREQMLLHLPMKSLCREDCRGLCPVCGQNLNIAECSCQMTPIDPRMLKLKHLFEK